MEDVNDLQRKYLSQVVDLVKMLWIENQGMRQILEQSRDIPWEATLRLWCDAPQNKAAANETFYLLAAVIQKAKLDSVALKELSEALAQTPPGFRTKES